MAIIVIVCVCILIWKWNHELNKSSTSSEKMWEILVPASSKDHEYSYAHHKIWDEYVKSLAGGLTIMKSAKGEWIDNSTNKLYRDRIIPVRIKCSKKNIKNIIKFTIQHYNQEAVLAYKISNKVYLVNKNEFTKSAGLK